MNIGNVVRLSKGLLVMWYNEDQLFTRDSITTKYFHT